MRVILYFLILISLIFVPLQRIEIANLEPIQGIWMHVDDGSVILKTDTKDNGAGATVEEAVMDMKQNSSRIIYLETAEYLFVSETALKKIPEAKFHLNNSVKLCVWSGEGEIMNAVRYANSHKIGIKFKDWETTGNLPELPSEK